jgi:hypothetical protein
LGCFIYKSIADDLYFKLTLKMCKMKKICR